MYPFIRSGDLIELVPIRDSNNLRKGEIILFIKDGHLYVHRIIKKRGSGFITRGDFSFGSDGNIPQKDILAKVASVERKGSRIYLYCRGNRFIAVSIASLGFFLQYLFLILRRCMDLAMAFLSRIQGIRIYRRLIKKFLKQDVIIRTATTEDKEALRDLYIASSMDMEKAIIDTRKEGFYLVAERKGKIAGSLTITRYKDTKLWLIFGLVVKPFLRGLGIGERFVKEAIIKAGESDAGEIGLFINKNSSAALRLYKKLGFEVSPEFPPDFNLDSNELYMKYCL